MAVNLRKKIGSEYTILICDVVQEALQKFQEEAAGTGPIEVVKTGYEAVQAAVRALYSTLHFLTQKLTRIIF
jgi:3-hydroxyisobutyrate dehydrogenase